MKIFHHSFNRIVLFQQSCHWVSFYRNLEKWWKHTWISHDWRNWQKATSAAIISFPIQDIIEFFCKQNRQANFVDVQETISLFRCSRTTCKRVLSWRPQINSSLSFVPWCVNLFFNQGQRTLSQCSRESIDHHPNTLTLSGGRSPVSKVSEGPSKWTQESLAFSCAKL